jgi:hypothetical protein
MIAGRQLPYTGLPPSWVGENPTRLPELAVEVNEWEIQTPRQFPRERGFPGAADSND